jgi:hypothetical protein
MEDYVRVALHAMDNRSVWVFLSVVLFASAEEGALECDACARRGNLFSTGAEAPAVEA